MPALHRRQRQPAVAHHHRGNAVLRLAGAVGIPEHLRIQMGMVVDKTRRHRQAVGVDGARRAIFEPSHFGDFAVFHPDVGDDKKAVPNRRRRARRE